MLSLVLLARFFTLQVEHTKKDRPICSNKKKKPAWGNTILPQEMQEPNS